MLQKIKSLSLLLLVTVSTSITAQLKVPAPSPLQTVTQAFGLSEIKIEYSRPSAKGRVIFGDVVPFGKVWRTGANSATKITFGDDVKIEGNAVAAGTYALYTTPNKDNWEIMLYKDLTLGGNVADYKKENELARFSVKPKAMSDKKETFTIDIADMTANSANIELVWENTRVAFNVTTDIDSKIMKNIEANVIGDNRPYFQAATYYYENNKDLAKALEWSDKAIATNPKAYWMLLLKAKIQAKQGDKKGAVTTAEQVVKLATEGKNDDYVTMANKLIAENKK
ncbi:MAG: hypothetical protein K0Q95_3322 [Bacteroidota bacterium]|jgi:tetratricopeptide (TPR) repeat protein|nr:hypothetical protein [Bacteroidota bacterium]